jgi:uncharacterized membrane-anchored protein
MRSKLSVIGLVLVLVAVNLMIVGKETALARGTTVILELRPVDPRSLMQGDYMILRYALADDAAAFADQPDGTVYLGLDSRGVATSVAPKAAPGLLPLRYRRHQGRVIFDAEDYFFQEGQGHFFQDAKYGELKVDGQGSPLLVGLLDEKLRPIKP